MIKIKVLFVCVGNDDRGPMAESFLNKLAGDIFIAESAGLEPDEVNPLAVQVMKEEGVDISNRDINNVFEFFKQGKTYLYVITVCDEEHGEKCPLFPGQAIRIHWNVTDPKYFKGSDEEKLRQMRELRNDIKKKIQEFIDEVKGNYVELSFE